jgi:hypothetical protein
MDRVSGHDRIVGRLGSARIGLPEKQLDVVGVEAEREAAAGGLLLHAQAGQGADRATGGIVVEPVGEAGGAQARLPKPRPGRGRRRQRRS